MPMHKHNQGTELPIKPRLGDVDDVDEIPRHRMPEDSMPADTALSLVRDQLLLDGSARLNLATFVTTWMEPQADQIIAETLSKNMIDKDEYPQTAEIERRCVNILADLWHAPGDSGQEAATGCSTTGSSEAAMLAGMALKWRWRERRKAAGQDGAVPNLVMGSNVQVCWEKFCRYWEVEPRIVAVGGGATHLTAETAAAACDENTIGVVAVLGSTFDGSYEPVQEIAAALDALAAGGGPDVPLHVDAASGGFVAPFLDRELAWDFSLERVKSINASGHKYGLVYPGVGWVIWRSADDLPEDLIFNVSYLGGSMPTFALNFSRPGAQVVAQYYEFVRLGTAGYRSVQQEARSTAMSLAKRIEALGPFELLSRGDELPVVAFATRQGTGFSVYQVSESLRSFGWQVPAYPMPEGMEDVSVLRVVVRHGFSRELASLFMEDLERAIARLADEGKQGAPEGFHH
jgi:glutamate decarboxylase